MTKMAEFKITNTVFDKKVEIVEVAPATEDTEEEKKEQPVDEKRLKQVASHAREIGSFSISIDSTNDKSDYF